jgi:hypothetical protein
MQSNDPRRFHPQEFVARAFLKKHIVFSLGLIVFNICNLVPPGNAVKDCRAAVPDAGQVENPVYNLVTEPAVVLGPNRSGRTGMGNVMSATFLRRASALMTLTLGALLLGPCAAAQRSGVPASAVRRKQKPAAGKPAADQPASTIPAYQPKPLTPVPLDQVPAVAPVVKYKDGELSIEAHNSTLSDVLKAVRQQTGAELEIPPNASERVVADLGPGPARQVLADLLNGTHFNYVMVGSSTDPSAVQSIFLTSKATSGSVESAATGVGRPRLPEPAPAAVAPEPDPPDSDDAEANDDQQPPADQSAEQQNSQTPGQAPKTPEQLLQELQRQQQQQQQQNGQPGQAQPGIFPNQPPTAAPHPNKPE